MNSTRMRNTIKLTILLLLASCTCSAQQPLTKTSATSVTKPSATSVSQLRPRRQDSDSNGLVDLDPQDPQTPHSASPHHGPTQSPGPKSASYFHGEEQSQSEEVNSQQLNGAQQAGSHLADNLEQQQRFSSYQSHRPRKFAHPRRKSSGTVPGRAGHHFPSLSAIPRTGFRCKRGHPGYFADPETGCQVFHICQNTGRKSSFLCPAGSIFNQRYLVCDWWFDTTCEVSPNAPQTTGLDDNSITPGQGDLSLQASVYPRKPGGIHGNNVDDTLSSKPSLQQSNRNNNRQGSTYSFSFSQEHEPNTAAKFNNALTKFSAGVSHPQTEAFTVSSINFDSTNPPGNSHHSYQSQNFFFPHHFSTMTPVFAQTGRPKQDHGESNSTTPYNHRPTYDAEPDDFPFKQADENTFSERNEQAVNQRTYSQDNNANTPNFEQTALLNNANAQSLTSSVPNFSSAPNYNLQSDVNVNNQFYTPEPKSVSSTTLTPTNLHQQYEPVSQYQQNNNQYTQTNSQFPSTNVYQQSSNQYQDSNSQSQINNQHQQYQKYQQTGSQYPETVNQFQTNYSQYQHNSNQYQQNKNQYGNDNQYQLNSTTIPPVPVQLNTTQGQQYTINTAVPANVQQPVSNYQQTITNNQQNGESLHTSSSGSGNIHDNHQQYSTTAVSETTQSNSLFTDQTFTTVPTIQSSPSSQYTSKPPINPESPFIPKPSFPEVSNDIRNFYTDQTGPSTSEPSTQTTPPQTTPQPTEPSPKPEVLTVTPVAYHEPFSVTPSSPSPFTLSTTQSPPSENDLSYFETTEHPSTADDLKTTFDSDSQTTFLGGVNQINHVLDNPIKPIDVEIDNHQSPSPTPFTFNVGQGFAQEATPTSTPTSNHFSRFIIDIPDEVTSIKSTSFGQVGNEVQSPEEHAAPSYPFTARVNDFLSAIGHHDTASSTSTPDNVTIVAVTQAPPTIPKIDKFTLADVSKPSDEVKVPLASSESHAVAPSVVNLPFGARLRAPKRRIYRRRIVV